MQIREGEKQLKKPFSSPSEGQPAESADLKRRLAIRRKFVPWGGGTFNPLGFQAAIAEDADDEDGDKEEEKAEEQVKPAAPAAVDENPLILWRPGEQLQNGRASRGLCLPTSTYAALCKLMRLITAYVVC